MNKQTKAIVKQVLSEAADAPHFFDFSDAQRLNWMIERAYEIGQQQESKRTNGKRRGQKSSRRRAASRPLVSIVVKPM